MGGFAAHLGTNWDTDNACWPLERQGFHSIFRLREVIEVLFQRLLRTVVLTMTLPVRRLDVEVLSRNRVAATP
jgi:hypothetical protein